MTTKITRLTVKCYKGSCAMPISRNPHQIHYYINVDLLSDLAFLNIPFINVKNPRLVFRTNVAKSRTRTNRLSTRISGYPKNLFSKLLTSNPLSQPFGLSVKFSSGYHIIILFALFSRNQQFDDHQEKN